MQAEKRTVHVIRREWVLPHKAHETEVQKAIAAAYQDMTNSGVETDLWVVTSGEGLIVYWKEETT